MSNNPMNIERKSTNPAGGNETDFLTGDGRAGDGGGLTDMLVVTTTVGMVNRVHSHTTSTGPAVALGLELVERTTSLEQGLVDTATAGDDTDRGTSRARDRLLCARGQTNASLVLVGRVANDGRVVARRAGERTAVPDLLLHVADDSTLRALGNREDVADGESSLLAGVDECASVEALSRDESLLAELVAVRVAENDAREGCAATSVVDDLLDDAADVAVALGKVERPELGRVLVVVRVRLELYPIFQYFSLQALWSTTYNGVRAPLCANDPTHGLRCGGGVW
jgi:hypothetical protein